MWGKRLPAGGVVVAVLGLLGGAAMGKADVDGQERAGVPIEVQPADPSLAKIVLVAGRPSHGPGEHEFFAGCSILLKLLKENAGVFPVLARDGWPRDARTFAHARSLVFYMDGGAGHPILRPDHMQQLERLMDQGVGFVNLHYAVEYPKRYGETVLSWLGGYYETGFSINPVWQAHFAILPHHPITNGVKPFSIQDEWYYNLRFVPEQKGVIPILKATPPDATRRTPAAREHPGREEIVAWAFERGNGGRSFGFTGGHFHRNWGDSNFRRLVTNAILWTARVAVPPEGAKVDLDPADLKKNLDRKPGAKGG